MAANLTDADTGEQLARWVDWPGPLTLVHFSKTPNVVAKITSSTSSSNDIDTIVLTTNTPIKGVVLSVPISEGGPDAVWSDNFIDLAPGEEIHVQPTGLKGRKIETRWLWDWENEEGFEL
jgi:beta-mannosidase